MGSMPPVQLATGVWRVPTLGSSAINSFAFVDDDGSVALVDAGRRGAPRRLIASLSEIGKRPADVACILLTHAHIDHAGGTRGLRERTGAPVHVHHNDAATLRDGTRPSTDPTTRLAPLARVLAMLPPAMPSCPVDSVLGEGDVVSVAGGIHVLHTPGHTPGHCSFLHERSGVLITGDAIINLGNRLAYSIGIFCSDVRQSRQTAERLGDVDYEIAAFAHGPEIRQHARETIRAFLSGRRAHAPASGRRALSDLARDGRTTRSKRAHR